MGRDEQSELARGIRWVTEAERIVEDQRQLVERLRRDNLPTETAERLLDRFEITLRQHRDHLARLLAR